MTSLSLFSQEALASRAGLASVPLLQAPPTPATTDRAGSSGASSGEVAEWQGGGAAQTGEQRADADDGLKWVAPVILEV